MADNNTMDWTNGLKIVLIMKNQALHYVIERSPYKAMFRCKAQIGLASSSPPTDVFGELETEEDLENVISSTKEVDKIANDDKENKAIRNTDVELEEAPITQEKMQSCIFCHKPYGSAHSCKQCGSVFFNYKNEKCSETVKNLSRRTGE